MVSETGETTELSDDNLKRKDSMFMIIISTYLLGGRLNVPARGSIRSTWWGAKLSVGDQLNIHLREAY